LHYVPQQAAAARFHQGAKNIAQAPGFGREAYRLVDWMQTQPGLAEPYRRLKRRIWAGAHRMNGRYLLDAGLPRQSLACYLRSLATYPPIALQETRRILFAAASLVVNVDGLRQRFLRARKEKLNL
jgi:hypothetical protein